MIARHVIATTASVSIGVVAPVLLLQCRLTVPEPARVAAAALVGIVALR